MTPAPPLNAIVLRLARADAADGRVPGLAVELDTGAGVAQIAGAGGVGADQVALDHVTDGVRRR